MSGRPVAQMGEAATAPESLLAMIGSNSQHWSEFLAERLAGREVPHSRREPQHTVYYTFALPGPAALPIWDAIWCSHSARTGSQSLLSYYSTTSSSRTLATSQLGLWEPEQESMPTFRPLVPEATWASEGKLKQLFERAMGEYFEDGVESNFTLQMRRFVSRAGQDAATVILRLLSSDMKAPNVWGEAMRWIGRAEGEMPKSDRVAILEKGLSSSNHLVRDGAILGFASMDDPNTIPILEGALSTEVFPGLRRDISTVIAELRNR